MTEHTFEYTGEAYDAVQCDDSIKDGDTLVCESARVVGIAFTWPIAVTAEAGDLHVCNDPLGFLAGLQGEEYIAMTQGAINAIAKAKELGIPLAPQWVVYDEYD